jgi:hypothetical protein
MDAIGRRGWPGRDNRRGAKSKNFQPAPAASWIPSLRAAAPLQRGASSATCRRRVLTGCQERRSSSWPTQSVRSASGGRMGEARRQRSWLRGKVLPSLLPLPLYWDDSIPRRIPGAHDSATTIPTSTGPRTPIACVATPVPTMSTPTAAPAAPTDIRNRAKRRCPSCSGVGQNRSGP